MNEKLNLVEILKDAPKGTTLYSSVLGDVVLDNIYTGTEYPIAVSAIDGSTEYFTEDGKLLKDYNGECVLFPSRTQRIWAEFTAPLGKKGKFDPKTLQPFDRVLCQHDNYSIWQCNLFSHIHADYKNLDYPVHGMSNTFMYCIPYNDDTKHLVGTTEEAPKFYRYWED